MQSVASQTADTGFESLIPAGSHTFMEIDHGKISMIILFLLVIQKGLLSNTRESMCTKYRPRGCKTFFMLKSVEHEIYLAHKC